MFWQVSDHTAPALDRADESILVGPMEDVR
jgi:hypothetical protein